MQPRRSNRDPLCLRSRPVLLVLRTFRKPLLTLSLDRAAECVRTRFLDRLSAERRVKRSAEIVVGDRLAALVVIDRTVIEQDVLRVEVINLGRDRCTELVGDDVAFILEDRELVVLGSM